MGEYKSLFAYKKAFDLAMTIFQITRCFPTEERFSLTTQFRNSSRSVCSNMAEAYRRRKTKAFFISKLNDCETENAETEVWIDFSLACGYISTCDHVDLTDKNTEVGKLIAYMLKNPDKFM